MIKLPSVRSIELQYDLNDEEIDSIANLTNVDVDAIMVTASYRFRENSQEVELYEYNATSAHVDNFKWFTLAKGLDSMVSALLDETKVIDYIMEHEDSERAKAMARFIESKLDESRGLIWKLKLKQLLY